MSFPLSDAEHNAIKRRIEYAQEELVVAAAVRVDGATISFPRPGRHGDCLNWLARHGISRNDARDQGFLTNLGRFVDRAEAGRIVVAAGQGSPRLDPPGINPNGHLFSEDMWNDVDAEPHGPIDPRTIFGSDVRGGDFPKENELKQPLPPAPGEVGA